MKLPLVFREAFYFVLILGGLSLLFLSLPFKLAKVVGFLFLLGFFFLFYFFRDPERTIPADPQAILAPADGKIVEVDIEEKSPFFEGRAKKISIFLSIFDVHVNRSPVEGKIIKKKYHRGAFLDARNPRSSEVNESQDWWIETPGGYTVGVRQIAGLIARRLVGWKEMGQKIYAGERIGMIKFGSRTELYLPVVCTLEVKPGDRVEAGKSIVAKWP